MNSENSAITNNIAQSDPSWDYYIVWHTLFKAKFLLEALLKYISEQESDNAESNTNIDGGVEEIVNLLKSI